MRILQSMLTALVNAPVRMAALGWRQPPGIDTDPEAAVNAVLSATGEVSSLVYASTLLDQIEAMEDSELATLMTHIATRFDLNGDQLARAAAAYATSPDAAKLAGIAAIAEPRWMELFRRLNATDGGTVRLVRLRERLLRLRRETPDAARLDGGLKSLLRMWFNEADTDGGGLAFEDLPSDLTCPVCGAKKSAYHPITFSDAAVQV
ncbi:MAG: rubredoxin [Candidatus Puniceispirillaceae bacterium]